MTPIIALIPLLCIIILWACYFDAKRDAVTSLDHWPQSGFRIMRRGLRLRRAKTKEDSARAETEGYKLFYTIDASHKNKWCSFYPPLAVLWCAFTACVYVVAGTLLAGMAGIALVAAAYVVWQLPPKPWGR